MEKPPFRNRIREDDLVNARLFYVKQFVRNRRYPAYDHSGDLNSHFIAL